jgi:small-conductance mechanosensitive channel
MRTSELLKSAYSGYLDAFLQKVPAMSAALVVVALFILVVGLISFIVRRGRITRRRQLIARIAQVIVSVVGGILALSILGVNLTGLLAGLGLLSVGFSFAMQDLLVNFLAGLELLGQSSFEIGDIIAVNGVEGTVRKIGARAIKLESNTGELVFVPNRDVLLKPLEVFKTPRGEYLILRFDVDVARVKQVGQQVMQRLSKLPGIAPAGIAVQVASLSKNGAAVEVHCRLDREHPPRATLHARGLEVLADLVSSN